MGVAVETVVEHSFPPVYDAHSRILILGTMPSPRSRENGFYYGHPQNRFWPVLAAVLGEELPQTNEEKRAMLLRHGIALWDVLQRCTVTGAADSSIRDPVPNDLRPLLQAAPITAVFTTGTTAYRLYERYCRPDTGMAAVLLPSPSAANARCSLPMLQQAYRTALLPHLRV